MPGSTRVAGAGGPFAAGRVTLGEWVGGEPAVAPGVHHSGAQRVNPEPVQDGHVVRPGGHDRARGEDDRHEEGDEEHPAPRPSAHGTGYLPSRMPP